MKKIIATFIIASSLVTGIASAKEKSLEGSYARLVSELPKIKIKNCDISLDESMQAFPAVIGQIEEMLQQKGFTINPKSLLSEYNWSNLPPTDQNDPVSGGTFTRYRLRADDVQAFLNKKKTKWFAVAALYLDLEIMYNQKVYPNQEPLTSSEGMGFAELSGSADTVDYGRAVVMAVSAIPNCSATTHRVDF